MDMVRNRFLSGQVFQYVSGKGGLVKANIAVASRLRSYRQASLQISHGKTAGAELKVSERSVAYMEVDLVLEQPHQIRNFEEELGRKCE